MTLAAQPCAGHEVFQPRRHPSCSPSEGLRLLTAVSRAITTVGLVLALGIGGISPGLVGGLVGEEPGAPKGVVALLLLLLGLTVALGRKRVIGPLQR